MHPIHLVFKELRVTGSPKRSITRLPFPVRPLIGSPGNRASPHSCVEWWRRPDSNRRPPGCKPGALPTELRPLADCTFAGSALSGSALLALCPHEYVSGSPVPGPRRVPALVGLGGFEPPTSRLSGGRSNQLSYRPADAGGRMGPLAPVSKN